MALARKRFWGGSLMQWEHDGTPNASGVVSVIQGWNISVATSMTIDHIVICATMR